LTGALGVANEPALTIGDWTRQFMLAPPFAWRWNRVDFPITITAGVQDYSENIADFGWLEKAYWTDSNGNTKELSVVLDASIDPTPNEPVSICARIDDGNGNIGFRIFPSPPSNVASVTISYQKAAKSFVALTDTWSPIPDYFYDLYQSGFLAKSFEYWNDERFGPAMQIFVRQVIAANQGLSESQINVFLADKLNTERDKQTDAMKNQSGVQGRGLF